MGGVRATTRRPAAPPSADGVRSPTLRTSGQQFLRRAALWFAGNFLVLALIALSAGAFITPEAWQSLDLALQPSNVAIVVAATTVAVTLNTIRWLVLWRSENGPSPLARQALFYLAGNAMSATPGRAGELIRLWLNRRDSGISYMRSLPVFVLDRMSDTASVVLCGLAGFVLGNGRPEAFVPVACVLVLMLLVLRRPSLCLKAIHVLNVRLVRVKSATRTLAALALLLRRTARLHNRPAFLAALLVASASRLVQCGGLSLILSAMGHEVSFALALVAYAAGSLAGAASMLPGGLGAAEMAMAAVLVSGGLPMEPAIASVLVFRIGGFWLATGTGILSLSTALLRPAAYRETTDLVTVPGASSRPRKSARQRGHSAAACGDHVSR